MPRRGRKKSIIPSKPKEKLYCPRSCIRYDNTLLGPTVWVCRMCIKCLFSSNACKQHVKICNPKKPPLNPPPIPVPSKKTPVPEVPLKAINQRNEEHRYVCNSCGSVFSRQVSLNKHLKDHEKSSGEDSD